MVDTQGVMEAPKLRIPNDNIAAVVALFLSFLGLYLVGSIAHPYLLGIGEAPNAGHTQRFHHDPTTPDFDVPYGPGRADVPRAQRV